jgi:hypothetical protein
MSFTPKKIERDAFGLIKGIEWKNKEETNFIDWRAMIPNEFLYVNPAKSSETDVTKADDSALVVKLHGMIYLAKLRGYHQVYYTVHQTTPDYSAVSCTIHWIPNYETEGQQIQFTSTAAVHCGNANAFAMRYSLETAENRAFCKCVRKFLGIAIVSQEELGEAAPKEEIIPKSKVPYEKLEKVMLEKSIDFPKLKELLIKTGDYEGAENYTSVTDIPTGNVLISLIERLKKYKSKD